MTKAPILDLQWSLYSPMLYTVGADHNLCITDVTTGQRIRKIRAHREIINSLDRTMAGGAGVELVATASDDKPKHPVATFEMKCPAMLRVGLRYPEDSGGVFAFGSYKYPDILSLSPNGHFLLSPSLSSQTLIHDVRPFSSSPTRVHRSLQGAPAGFENTLLRGAWSKDDGGQRVAVGGADQMVCIWDVESGRFLYKLPGHKGTVTAVDFHPKKPIILTASKDATMLLGEIQPSPNS
ncbi:WD40-repeat-containing domain protein [Mycena floridula]|nr:WD40-repeat-containing domain protein [Mycena floridula]